MENDLKCDNSVSQGTYIINKAQSVNLDPKVLYEAVIDLSAEGLLTANCINMAVNIRVSNVNFGQCFIFVYLGKAKAY